MPSNADLFNAIYTKVKAFAAAQSVQLSYEFKTFEPPESGVWLELSYAGNDRDYDLSSSPVFRRGIVQLNVCTHKDQGDYKVRQMIDAIEAEFTMGAVLFSPVIVTTNPKAEAPFIRDSSQYITQVSFEYAE